MRHALLALTALGLVCAMPATHAQQAPAAARGAAAAKTDEWRAYHGNLQGQRYSPLDQINADNIENLGIAWTWKAENMSTPPEYRSSVTPLMANGVLYLQAGYGRSVVALDPGSGETLWTWRNPNYDTPRERRATRRNSGRGAAYWTNGTEERVFTVSPGFTLFALDAKTGRSVQSFGTNGSVDLKAALGTDFDVNRPGITMSSAPLVFENIIVISPALENGYNAPVAKNWPGRIMAFDTVSGKLLWRFNTIPAKGEEGYETWEDGSAEKTGNTGAWTSTSLDPETGYLYIPVESPTNDYYGGHRPGNNLFGSSLVCLDVRTGKKVWHYQIIHHDIFDYDIADTPTLVDITVDGKPVKAVAVSTKQSFMYVFDRLTGRPVWPITEQPVPQSDVPTEKTSPTQPMPSKPKPFDVQGITVDDLIDFTPALRQEAIKILSPYRMGKLFAPGSLADAPDGTKGTLQVPGDLGGANWEHGAYDPETHVYYVGSWTAPVLLAMYSDPKASDMQYIGRNPKQVPNVRGLPVMKPPYSRITAIDMDKGEHLWWVPNGPTPKDIANNPLLKGLNIPRTGARSRPSLLVTKTLLFNGDGWGGGPYFRALDKKTGKTLWETVLPGAVATPPITYLHKGKQYVAFWVGSQQNDQPAELVAMALAEPPRTANEASTAALKGWTSSGGATWSVADGATTGVSKAGASYLKTVRGYADVNITLEFMADKTAKGGVMLRCRQSDWIPLSARSCYEVVLSDSFDLWPTGSITDVAATTAKLTTADKWNTLEIRAEGSHIVVKVNGQVTTDAHDSRIQTGAVALEAALAGSVRFRNVKITPLGE